MDFIYNLDQDALGKAGVIAQIVLIAVLPAAVAYFKLKKEKS